MPNSNLGVGGGGGVTSIGISGGTTGLSSSGGPITSSGTITLTGGPIIDGTGTGGKMPLWSDSNTLADSHLSDSGTVLTASERLVTVASGSGAAGLNIPAGSAPASPADGDVWTTTAGIYVRINGATVGPLAIAPTTNTLFSVSTPVILTNAQIKALDPTAIQVLPAPSAGFLNIPWLVLLQASYPTSQSYINLHPDGTEMGLQYANGHALGAAINATNLLGTGGTTAVAIAVGPYYTVPGLSTFGTDAVAFSMPNDDSGQAIQLWMDNNGQVPLTGGNVANTIKVTLWYMTVALYA